MDSVIWIGSYKFDWIDITLIGLVVYIIFKMKNNKKEDIEIEIEKSFLENIRDNETKAELERLKESYNELEDMYKVSTTTEMIMGIVIMIQNAFIREIQNANIEMQSFSNALDKLEMMTSDIDYAREVILENRELITLYLFKDEELGEKIGEFLEKLNEKEMGEK